MVQIGRRAAAAPKKAKKASSFVIDCSKPVEDSIMEIAAFEKFLVDKIKVDGKTGAWEGPGWSRLLPLSAAAGSPAAELACVF